MLKSLAWWSRNYTSPFSKVIFYIQTQSTLPFISKYNEDIHTYHDLGLKICVSYLTSVTNAEKDFFSYWHGKTVGFACWYSNMVFSQIFGQVLMPYRYWKEYQYQTSLKIFDRDDAVPFCFHLHPVLFAGHYFT